MLDAPEQVGVLGVREHMTPEEEQLLSLAIRMLLASMPHEELVDRREAMITLASS